MSDEKPITKAAAYAWMVPRIAEVARERGYAIGLHGSLHRDLDLIAVPWIENAVAADVLIEAIRDCIGGRILPTGTPAGRWDTAKGEFVACTINNPDTKPHGRLAWNIHLDCGFVVDVSVTARVIEKHSADEIIPFQPGDVVPYGSIEKGQP